MPDINDLLTSSPFSIVNLVINLAIGAVISFVIAWHFRQYGQTMGNRAALAWVFPMILMTTILVISVVKSSLALSLGLVGALSIVRFRTPIKEPEELAYLFLAIGVGLGLGANQTLPTVIASTLILGMLGGRSLLNRSKKSQNLFVNIEISDDSENHALERLNDILRESTSMADIRRIDIKEAHLHATYLITCESEQQLITTMNNLRESFSGAAITFVDQSNWSMS